MDQTAFEDVTIRGLAKYTESNSTALNFFSSISWVKKSRKCVCGQTMHTVTKNQLTDGCCLVCSSCKKQQSIRTFTVFSGSKMQIQTILYLLYFFCQNIGASVCSRMMGKECHYNSVLEWYEIFRGLCSKYMIANPLLFGDDVSINYVSTLPEIETNEKPEVEVDESFFGKKAKYDRGTSRQNYMIFGIVARKGNACVLCAVPTNSREALFPLIEQYVNKNCIIYHDGLATYSTLDRLGYTHKEVNHSIEFCTEDGIHTNTIEGLWGLAKQHISSMHGIKSYERLVAHLDEFSYRHTYGSKGSIWNCFLKHVSSIYTQ